MVNLKTLLTSDGAELGQVDIREDTLKLFLVTLAVYSSYVATEWQGRKREGVH